MGRDAEFQGIAVGPLRDREFALRGAGHALLINGPDDDTSAVIARQFEHLEEALVAVLVVGGVEDAFAASHLEAGLHLLPLRGVQHQGEVDVGHQTAHQRVHVRLAIAADVVDVDVENVGVLLHLAAGNGDQTVPVFFREQLTNFLRATGVQAFANDQEGVVLQVGGDSVDRAG